MMKMKIMMIITTSALAFIAAGCEVRSDLGYGGGNVDGTSSAKSASPLFVECAPNEPTSDEGASCYSVGRVCEYGTAADPQCNRSFVCTASGAAAGSSIQFMRNDAQSPCPSAASAQVECPAPGEVPADGAPCTTAPNQVEGRLCPNASGATCACTTGPNGAHAHAARWVCVKPKADGTDATLGCPTHRPLLGTECVSAGAICDYGSCAFKHGIRVECTGPDSSTLNGFISNAWREAPAMSCD